MGIVSNLIEYLEYNIVTLNATRNLLNDTDMMTSISDRMTESLILFDYFRLSTLNTVSMLNPEV